MTASADGVVMTASADLAGRPTLSLLVEREPEPPSSSHTEALRLEEIERSRVFFITAFVLAIGGIALALVTNGDPVWRSVLVIGSASSASASAYCIVRVLHPDRYHPRRLFVPAIPIVFGALTGVCYWGPISPVVGMLVYGIYFFSLGRDVRFINTNYAVIALGHGAIALMMMFGVMSDRSVVPMATFGRMEQVSLLVMIEVIYLLAFVTARLSHKATRRAMSELEDAVRGVAQREALLVEARAELQRVRAIGGAGKYSEQVVGAYRLGTLIGRGGIGEVYDATHVSTQQPAAMKLLRADALGDAIQIQRLLREAKAAARVECANVVRVFDVGTTSSGMPFVVMERMQGYDLAHELRSRRRLALAAAVTVIDDIAAGLEAARLVGIVHRDLKPHNVFGAVTGEHRVWKILDFGVSKVGTAGTLTAGKVIGTPSYMSPEQARAEDVDHRADVYSLAAILFRAVTGYATFSGNDIAATIYAVVHRVPDRPSSLAELPPDVDRVLAVGLAKARADRFATAVELARWFAAAVDSRLTAEQRARADELIARSPWGSITPA